MKTILITAGGTIEPIDGVRGITNFSSGALGATLADCLSDCEVILIKGSKSVNPQNIHGNITIINTTDTNSVQKAINEAMAQYKVDYFIHSMAISDYTVDKVVSVDELINNLDENTTYSKNDIINLLQNPPYISNRNKVSSSIKQPIIYLKQTPKIVASIKKQWPDVKLISFKLLNNVPLEELISVAKQSAKTNNSDFVVANDLSTIKNGQHIAYILKDGKVIYESHTKDQLAFNIKQIIST